MRRRKNLELAALMASICLAVVVATALMTCGKSGGKKKFESLADFEGARIASQTGAVFAQFIDPVILNVEHRYFNTVPEIVAALSAGKVDAVSLDMPAAKHLAAQYSDFIVFPDVVAPDRYGFAVAKGSALGKMGNEALHRLKESGAIKAIENVWFSADESKKILPQLSHKEDFDGNAGTIRYGYELTIVPMSYIGTGGSPVGFDLDLVSRIAYELNMTVEFVPMSFDALLPALAAGKVDMVGACMSITEERLKTVDFIGPYYEGGITLMVKKDRLVK